MAELTSRAALDPFGQTLFVDDLGDLVLERDNAGLLGLRTSGGPANLGQGLRITVETPLGSDIFNEAFGFDLLSILRAGYPLELTKQLIRLHTVRAITSDDRVQRIEDLVFDDDSQHKVTRRWQLDVLIQPIAGRPVSVPVRVTGV